RGGEAGDAEIEVDLLEGTLHDREGRPALDETGGGVPALDGPRHGVEVPARFEQCHASDLDEVVVVDGSRGRDDEIARPVIRSVVLPDGVTRDRTDRLRV